MGLFNIGFLNLNCLSCNFLKHLFCLFIYFNFILFSPLHADNKALIIFSLSDRDSISCFLERGDTLNALKKINEEFLQLEEVEKDSLIYLINYELNQISIPKDSLGLSYYIDSKIKFANYFSDDLNKKFEAVEILIKLRDHLLNSNFHLSENLPRIEYKLGNILNSLDNFELSLEYYNLSKKHYLELGLHERVAVVYKAISTLYYYQLNEEEMRINNELGLKYAIKYNSPIGQVSNLLSLYEYHFECEEKKEINRIAQLIPKLLSKCTKHPNYDFYADSWEDSKLLQINDIKNYQNRINNTIPALQDSLNSSRDKAKNCIELIECYFHLNKFDSAYYYYKTGMNYLIPNFDSIKLVELTHYIYYENSFLDLFYWAAKLMENSYYRTNDKNYLYTALKYVDLTIASYKIELQSFAIHNTELTNIKLNKKYVDMGITYSYYLYKAYPTPKNFDLARHYFNLSKAFQLNEKISWQNNQYTLDSITKEKLKTYYDSLTLLFSLNSSHLIEKNEKINYYQQEIEKLNKKSEFKFEFGHIQGNYIEYASTSDSYYRIAEVEDKYYFDKLAKTYDIDSLVERFENYRTEINNDSKILSDLYTSCIGSLPIHYSKHLTIIPDSKLSLCPFEVFTDITHGNLLNKHIINYAYSYLTFPKQKGKQNKDVKIFCYQPEYEQLEIAYEDIARDKPYELPYADAEINAIQTNYPISFKRNIDMTTWRKCIDSASYFHFIGHAGLDNDIPYMNMGIHNPERITAQVISATPNQLEMAFLSACLTGKGRYDEGEGVWSLGKSFMQAGTTSVISSLWSINDNSTAIIVSFFYKFLKQGFSKAEALSKAKLQYLNQVNAVKQHPLYWAGLVLYGDAGVQTGFLTYEWKLMVLIACLLFIALLMTFYFNKKLKY